jgi:hypothetical protein
MLAVERSLLYYAKACTHRAIAAVFAMPLNRDGMLTSWFLHVLVSYSFLFVVVLCSYLQVILCHANARPPLDFSAAADQVLPHLFRHCESPEEGVRNMVCIHVLCMFHE